MGYLDIKDCPSEYPRAVLGISSSVIIYGK